MTNTYKLWFCNFAHELPREFPKDVRFKKLKNIRKISWVKLVSLPEQKISSNCQQVRKSRYQSFVVLSNFIQFSFFIPKYFVWNSRYVAQNMRGRNISNSVRWQPQLLFVIFKGSKQLLTATFNFNAPYILMVC